MVSEDTPNPVLLCIRMAGYTDGGYMGLTHAVIQRSVMILGVLLLVSCSGTEYESTETEIDGPDSSEVEEPILGAIVPVYQLQQDVPMTMTISTTSLKETGFLLVDFTCEGENSSPQIGWDNTPESTQSIAIVAEDRDFHGGIASHWIIWGIPGNTTEVASGISGSKSKKPSGSTILHSSPQHFPANLQLKN